MPRDRSYYITLVRFCRRSYTSIAKECNLQYGIVRVACENWEKYRRVTNFKKRNTPKHQIPSDIVEWITGHEGLVEYRFLSLAQRCHRLYARFGLVISPHGLTLMYRRAGINYTHSRPQVHKIVEDPNTIPDRKEAALHLKHLLATGEPVCFIDETRKAQREF